jgi:LysM repeat protein
VGRLWLVDRRVLARYVAPAIFLLAVTAVALVVRSALRSDGSGTGTTSTTVSTRTSAARVQPGVSSVKRYYVIRSGDTLDRIADRFSTTVGTLLRLNPGVEPTALIPGHQVRVK